MRLLNKIFGLILYTLGSLFITIIFIPSVVLLLIIIIGLFLFNLGNYIFFKEE